jgi:hypothetical protein
MKTELASLPVLRPRKSALTAPAAAPGLATRLLFLDDAGGLFHTAPPGWDATPIALPTDARVLAAAVGRTRILALLEDAAGSATVARKDVDGEGWETWPLPFACRESAALTPSGDAIVVDASGRVVLLDFEARSITPISEAGFARQVHCGSDGSLWAVLEAEGMGGYSVAVRPAGGGWRTLPRPASALRIVGLGDGTAYGLNPLGEVWRFHPEGVGSFAECSEDPSCRNCLFSERRSGFQDLAIGPDEVVWAVNAAGRAVVVTPQERVWLEAPIARGVRAVFGSRSA